MGPAVGLRWSGSGAFHPLKRPADVGTDQLAAAGGVRTWDCSDHKCPFMATAIRLSCKSFQRHEFSHFYLDSVLVIICILQMNYNLHFPFPYIHLNTLADPFL